MNHFTQIVYVSRATFPLSDNPYQMEPEVADILQKSRVNNKNNHIVGALCFGDGYFLQCLQGHNDDVNALINVLKKDKRHTDMTILSNKEIQQRSFSKWHMKYAGLGSDIHAILHQHKLKSFNPNQFSPDVLEEIIQHLAASYTI